MKSLKQWILILMVFVLSWCLPAAALCEGTLSPADAAIGIADGTEPSEDESGWLYALNEDGTAVICGVKDASASVLTVPFSLGGAPVTAIGPGAFAGMTQLEGVLIHAGVTDFDAEALAGLDAVVYAYNGAPALEFAQKAGIAYENLSTFDFAEDVLDFCAYSGEHLRLEGTRVWVSADVTPIFAKGMRFFAAFDEDETQTVRQVESVVPADGGAYLSCSIVPAHEVLRSFSFDIDEAIGSASVATYESAKGVNGTNYVDTKSYTSNYKTKNGLLSVKFDVDFDIDPDVSGKLSYDSMEDFRCIINYTADVTVTGTLGGTLLSADMLKLELESMSAVDPVEIDLLDLPKKIKIPDRFEFSYDVKLILDLKLVGEGKVHFEGSDGFVYEYGVIKRVNDHSQKIDDATVYGEMQAGFDTSAVLKIPFYGKFLSLSAGAGLKAKTETLPSASTQFYCVSIPVKLFFDASLKIEPPVFRSLSYSLMSMEFPVETYHLEIPSSAENYWALHLGKKCTIDPDSIETIQLVSGTDQVFDKIQVIHGSSIADSLDYEPLVELEGNEFVGWFDQPTGGTQYDLGASVTPGYPDILYARFRKLPVTVTIDYQWDLLENVETKLYPGSKVTAPKINQRLGYKLNGWFTDSTLWDFETMLVPETDLYIYASWEEVPGYNPFTTEIDSIRNADSNTQEEYFSNFVYADMMSTGLQGMGLTADDDADLAKLHSVVSITGYNGSSPAFVPPDYVNAIKVKVINGSAMTKGSVVSLAAPQHCLIIQNMNNEPNMLYAQLNDQLAILDSNCFANNTLLQHYNIGSNLRKIGSGAFLNCISLLEAEVGDCITVEKNAFRNCISLVRVNGTMNHVQANVFNNCASLVSPPKMVNAVLRTGAFANCTALKQLDFEGNTIFYPEDYSFFDNCTALEGIYFNGDVNELDISYANLESLKSIEVSGSCGADVRLIDMPSLETLYISGDVNGEVYLEDMPSLEYVYIGGNVNGRIRIDEAPNLRTVYIGGTVTGGISLNNMPYLTDVTVEGEIIVGSDSISIHDCASLETLDLSMAYCSESNGVYLYNNPALKNVTLPDTLQAIPYRAFANCTSLEEITLPAGIGSVGKHAFKGCTSLRELKLNEGLTMLGLGALDGCKKITRLAVPDSVVTLDSPISEPSDGGTVLALICTDYSKAYTYATETAWLTPMTQDQEGYVLCFSSNNPSGTSSHAMYILEAGADIASLEPEWTLPSDTYFSGWFLDPECTMPYDLSLGMPQGDTCLFMGRTNASKYFTYEKNGRTYTITGYVGGEEIVAIPEEIGSREVTGIAANAFAGTQVRRLTLPGGMTDVDATSFSGLDTLESIYVYGEPTGIQVIDGALYAADGETLLYLPAAMTGTFTLPACTKTIGAVAMEKARIDALVLNEGLKEIGIYAFAGMPSLKEITIPASVESIGSGAFKDCLALEKLTLQGEPAFGSYMFSLLGATRAYGPQSDALRTYFAHYLIPYNAYDLVWVSNGETVFTQEINQGAQFSCFTDVSMPDFVLEGWKEESAGELWDFTQGVMPGGNLTLHAVWAPVWQADENGMITSYNSLAGEEAVVPDTVDGAAVTGITEGAFDASVTRVVISSDVTIIEQGAFAGKPTIVSDEGSAAYSYALENDLPFERRQYTVVYDPAGGSVVASETHFKGDDLLLPSPVKDLCTFMGWYEGETRFDETMMPGRDLYLVAEWEEPFGYIPMFRTEIFEDGLWITGYVGKTGDVTIPAVINGQDVLGVKAGAFRGDNVMENVTVSDGVPMIGDEAFAGSAVRSVTFLGADTALGEGVLRGCALLSDLTLPAGLNGIPAQLAQNAQSLQNLVWPEAPVSIGDRAFENCASLNPVLPDTVETIGVSAFENCDSLTLSALPEKALAIGDRALAGCDAMTAFILPEGMETIPAGMFSGCASLESITLPSTLTVFDAAAFAGCESLAQIHIAEGSEYFSSKDGILLDAEGSTVLLCPAGRKDETLTLPQGVKALGAYSLSGCAFSEIVLPETLEEIGDYAMENCVNLTSIVLPESVYRLGSAIFSGCAQLTSIVLPENLTEVKADTFSASLTLNVNSDWHTLRTLLPVIDAGQSVEITPVETAVENILSSAYDDGVIITGVKGDAPGVVLPEAIDGKPVRAVAAGAFADIIYLKLPQTVTTLEDGALTGNPDLCFVLGGEGVVSAGRYAAEGTRFGSQDMVSLGSVLLACNSKSSSVSLNSGYTIIGADAFRGLTTLSSVSIEGVEVIGDRAFMDCKELYNVWDSESVTAFGEDVFKGSGLENRTITMGCYMLQMSPYASSKESFPGGLTGITTMLDGAMDNVSVSVLVIDAENCVLKSGCASGCETLGYLDATGVTTLTIEEGALPSGVTVCAIKDSAIWNRALELGLSVRESVPNLITLHEYDLPLNLSLGTSDWVMADYAGDLITAEEIICRSSDESVFTVEVDVTINDYGDSIGCVIELDFYAVSVGNATLTLGIGDAITEYPVTVIDDRMILSNVPDVYDFYIAKGENFQIEVMDGSGNPLTGLDCYINDYESGYVEVTPSGLLTGIEYGGAYVHVRKDGYRGTSFYVSVIEAPTGIELGLSEATMKVDAFTSVPITLFGTDRGRITVEVEDPSIVEMFYIPYDWTAENGNAQANASMVGLKPGKTRVTFHDAVGHSAQIQVTVTGVPVTYLSLQTDSIDLEVGAVYQIAPMILPQDASNKTLLWESSDPGVVDVDQTGTLRAMNSGSATITVSTTDGSNLSDSCTVNVIGVYISGPGVVQSGEEWRYIVRSPSGQTITPISWGYASVDADTFIDAETGVLYTDPTFEEDYVFTVYARSEDLNLFLIKDIIVESTWQYESGFTLPASLRAIAESSFTGAAFTSVRCPDKLEQIGKEAFKDCAALREIYLPASVSFIDETAFDGCSDQLIFYVQSGSYAETFAREHGFVVDVVSSSGE